MIILDHRQGRVWWIGLTLPRAAKRSLGVDVVVRISATVGVRETSVIDDGILLMAVKQSFCSFGEELVAL